MHDVVNRMNEHLQAHLFIACGMGGYGTVSEIQCASVIHAATPLAFSKLFLWTCHMFLDVASMRDRVIQAPVHRCILECFANVAKMTDYVPALAFPASAIKNV
jgi:hypothetical protein